jgi:hypothetical protein
MSGSLPANVGLGDTQGSVPLTDPERADIRYFCGYSLYGNSASGFAGYRFFESQGFLEYRLVNAAPEELQSIRQMVSEIQPLRTGILTSANTMLTAKAGAFVRNANEARDRRALYDEWRLELCRYLGVPPGPGIADRGSGRIVV